MKLQNGDYYKGQWLEGWKCGEGEIVYSNGDKYVGNWKNSQRHGYGSYFWSSSNQYLGNWKNDKMHGKGKLITVEGDEFEVMFDEGSVIEKKKLPKV